MNPAPLIVGAEPWSFRAPAPVGALVLHGFTGNPGSVRFLAQQIASAGVDVEMPLLPGHGTVMDDMLDTTWDDWYDAALGAYDTLRQRVDRVVIAGLSMGGTLTLAVGAARDAAALVCVNPAVRPQTAEVVAAVTALVDAGTEVIPGVGSDIADPEAVELAYSGTPTRALRSLLTDGLPRVADLVASIRHPLLLMTSPNDHVVEPSHSDYLAAHYGGEVTRVSLDRSYHVATQDYDKQLIADRTVAFIRQHA